MDKRLLLQLTADIVASHASMNEMGQEDLLAEIDKVYKKLASLAGEEVEEESVEAQAEPEGAPIPATPVVPPEVAFGKDKIYCMICGKGMKTLKRHLSTAHGLTPKEYLEMFGLPKNTPLVSEEYSEQRKRMAAELGLADKLVQARAARAAKRKAKEG
ncbi:Ros/MucR family transcriptional regulator [Deferrisoma palaeochoriense]